MRATASTYRSAINVFYTLNPRVANAGIGCVTFCLGDLLAQYVESKTKGQRYKPDFSRAASVGCFGAVSNGVFLHSWYLLLDKVVGSSMKSKMGVITKVVADQLVYAPFTITSYFAFASVRSSPDLASAKEQFLSKMKESFVRTFASDACLWPVANAFNFKFIPLIYRASFTAVVQVVWQTYLSVVANAHKLEADLGNAPGSAVAPADELEAGSVNAPGSTGTITCAMKS
ncbi:hypothetical protein B484DRAFT_452203 [Ochromonadaceae sp. CCMP2298]|nr:hypothetical protein B484DRAFT_452203 [Ochromonadaceae sp. CCMP2298]|mmetsp:Transcript_7893/g.17199  ORF Transcript_7893/g.17199 Transcript_7893/m.17199 type:complete len:230 (-) Transcript_7893:181-870(-)|eukprot:CAMPEP_0173171814 /NCGR_PEP_ID=MMETSP1141-20130122/1965_1 /TAXON_ID=483371 /ORGANISM="non described non described, Strain CCMP2298" /LENGTH=229 /DNA_ID=CAMNT_0014093787 /DNA_START=57 /DNA_END=746 /DNA_ORIENTATION=+